jgi:nicotinate phosphoribosyltransferase
MGQCVYHTYPNAHIKYRFKARNSSAIPANVKPESFVDKVNEQLDSLCRLKFTLDELSYLSTFKYLTPDFIRYLKMFQLDRSHIEVSLDNNKELQIKIEGPWDQTIYFEVPVLSIVSELYYHESGISDKIHTYGKMFNHHEDQIATLKKELSFLGKHEDWTISDFGTRRRFSYEYQRAVLQSFKANFDSDFFVGTSNVHFAKLLGLRSIGTMAHEFIMAHQQLGECRVSDSQKMALEVWAHEFRGELGIALSDTVGFDAFLRDFDLFFAKLFDGVRHDSGSPYEWGEKLLRHYEKLKIDPRTKTAVFSDGLTVEKAIDLYKTFRGRIKVACGIGTELTNNIDPTIYTPLNIVIKPIEVNGEPVAKVSDSKGKAMCENPIYEAYVKSVFHIEDK